jgi:hypothetical protein
MVCPICRPVAIIHCRILPLLFPVAKVLPSLLSAIASAGPFVSIVVIARPVARSHKNALCPHLHPQVGLDIC